MIKPLETISPKVLAFELSGTLHDHDYKTFVPIIDAAVREHGRVRVMALLSDFHGWDLQALWDDIGFASKHFDDIERIAFVGDRKWEEWMAKFCVPFTKASIHYFDTADVSRAWDWIHDGVVSYQAA